MALAVRNAASLKPEIRLAQAISEFEASLNAQHKAAFRNARAFARETPPTPSDVMRLTAEIDSRARQEHGPSRCFGPRLTNILQAVQQFAALGDTVVGGSQNIVACGVWSAVRMMLQMAIGYTSYLEKLSLLFMTAGRQAPRYQALAIIYPQSKELQNCLSEYFIVIVRICQRIQQYGKKSTFGQLKYSLNDADLKEYQADLEVWGNSIKDEASLLLNQRLQNESQENEKARTLVSKWSISSTKRYQALERIERVERKVRWLDTCSKYDFQTTWKEIRKQGSTSLLPTWPEYQRWKQKVETPSAILLSGNLGAGKSVAMANIVDDLHLSGDAVVVYFFCRHDIPKSLTSRTILGSLARQYLSHLLENNEAFQEDVQTLDIDELTALMMPKRDERGRYLLIDGLDECNIEERNSLLTQISWLQRQSNWRLGFSARGSTDSFVGKQISLTWHVSLPTNNPDIEQYIDSELRARLANGQLKVGDHNILSEIRTALLDGANGMFLWVALQLDQICLEVSDYSIRATIKSLPRDLSEVYARILSSSAALDTSRYHVRLFKFLAAAYTPLTKFQIRDMASVTIGDAEWDSSKLINDILKVIGYCGSLVIVEEEEQTVRFVHHSAKSFCQGVLGGYENWKFCFSDEEAHREMGGTAVTYLSYGIFDNRLSTGVIPKVDVGGITERIVQHTLSASDSSFTRLATSFIKSKRRNKRDIGQFLAHAQGGTIAAESETTSHPFLSYARKFWILHTRNIENVKVHELWKRLFNGVDICDLQLTPHVPGPLDTFQTPWKHPLASAFVWAVSYSHVALFDRLMELGDKYPFPTKLPWARFRFFRSLLQHLASQNSSANSPCLDHHIIERLFPLSKLLRVYRAVEWMLPLAKPKWTISDLGEAVSCHNYQEAALISTSSAFKSSDRVVLQKKLLDVAACSGDPKMISLLAKMDAAWSGRINVSPLSRVISSGMHQAPLMRIIYILVVAGFLPCNEQEAADTVYLLGTSPEINAEMASQALSKVFTSSSDFPRLHQRTFHRACWIGSFELAHAAWLGYFEHQAYRLNVSMRSVFPFAGDELSLVLQTLSKSRIKLANWLVQNGYQEKDQQIFRRAIVLRNWQLANELVMKGCHTAEALTFCENLELFHICAVGGDVVGIDFLLKIGMDFNALSTGPMFRRETPVQALTTRDSDYFVHLSIADLYTRGAFNTVRTPPSPAQRGQSSSNAEHYTIWMRDEFEEAMRCIRSKVQDSQNLDSASPGSFLNRHSKDDIGSVNYSDIILLLAATVRETVREFRVTPYQYSEDRLKCLKYLLEDLKDTLDSDLSCICDKHKGILAIRELFGAIADMDKEAKNIEELIFWEQSRLQMMFWQFANLFVCRESQDTVEEQSMDRGQESIAPPCIDGARNSDGPSMTGTEDSVEKLSRDGALRELSLLMCRRSVDGIFRNPASLLDAPGSEERVYDILHLADTNGDLPWVLQYLIMSVRVTAFSDFCSLSEKWRHAFNVTASSSETQRAFVLMGWTEEQLNEWKNVVAPMKPSFRPKLRRTNAW